jgi:D-lactate dehydrogenase (cytochrome)
MEARKMKALRHAVPEAVNERISTHARRVPGLHKVGTDLAVPDQGAAEMNGIYRERLRDSGMEYALFGHAAENHLHANLIPSSKEELDRARSLHLDLAREAVRLGGSVTAEHGIGRLKHELVPIQYGEAGVDALRGVKRFFDPEDRLNPGVIFPARP